MRLELSVQKRIFFILIIFLFIPSFFITSFIFKNTEKILKKKLNLEIHQREIFIKNYFFKQKDEIKKILAQLSTNKEILGVFKEVLVYNDEVSAKNKLTEIVKTIDADYLQLYTLDKKSVLSEKLKIPVNLLKSQPLIFYLDRRGEVFIVGTTPFFVGEEKSVFGYLAYIKKFDEKFLKNLSKVFNSPVKISIVKEDVEIVNLSDDFTPITVKIGETLLGKPIFFSCLMDSSFYSKFLAKNRIYFFLVILGLFGFCIFIAYTLSKAFLKPLKTLEKSINNFIAGPIKSVDITYRIKDEIYTIIESLNTFFGRLKSSFSELSSINEKQRDIINSLKSKSLMFSSNRNSLATNTSTLEENYSFLTDKLSQINSSLEQITSNYKKDVKIFEKIGDLTQEGFEISRISNITLKEINRNSEEIKNILSFITDISSQINLLSVNASIEAIKSGEAGSGFSVVADEIKRLAQTTNEFVDNIQKLIENNYIIVKQGAEYSQRLDSILKELNSEFSKASSIFSHINNLIIEQKQLLEELLKKVYMPKHITEVIDKNLKNIENIIENFEKEVEALGELTSSQRRILRKYLQEDKSDEIKKIKNP